MSTPRSMRLPHVRLKASQGSLFPSAVTFGVPFCLTHKKERLPDEGTLRLPC